MAARLDATSARNHQVDKSEAARRSPGSAPLAFHLFTIVGGDVEVYDPGRKVRVVRRAARAGVHPVAVESHAGEIRTCIACGRLRLVGPYIEIPDRPGRAPGESAPSDLTASRSMAMSSIMDVCRRVRSRRRGSMTTMPLFVGNCSRYDSSKKKKKKKKNNLFAPGERGAHAFVARHPIGNAIGLTFPLILAPVGDLLSSLFKPAAQDRPVSAIHPGCRHRFSRY